MLEESSDSSQSSARDALMQNDTIVENLMRELRAHRRTLEKLFVDTFQDFANRSAVWNDDVYNDRAVLLSKKKDEFFGLKNALIVKCEAYVDGRFEEIIDICDLFKVKIVSLWDEFVLLSRKQTNLPDMEKIAQDDVILNGVLTGRN